MNPAIDISHVVLRTDRLLLRPWRQSDLEDFYEYASVDGVGPMAGWKPHENRAESQRILDSFIGHKKTFALEHCGKVIGSLGIQEYSEQDFPELKDKRCRELGFVLSKAYWGRGLMPEAVLATVRYLFEQEKLDAILCKHFLWNRQSHRVQEKCGFRHYAYMKSFTELHSVEEDEVNILTRGMWENGNEDIDL